MTPTALKPWAPPDADQAFTEWRANCGPAALAAITGRTVGSLRRAFPEYPAKPWCNPTHMKAALDFIGMRHTTQKLDPLAFAAPGLCFIQWEGPWLAPGVPVGAAYRNTHWIATAGPGGAMVFDVNAGEWTTRGEWEADIVPLLVAHTKRATGGWYVRTHVLLEA